MAFGSRGAKDFGLSGNLTLPKGDAAGFSDPGMEEKEKKHARFAFDQNQDKVLTLIVVATRLTLNKMY